MSRIMFPSAGIIAVVGFAFVVLLHILPIVQLSDAYMNVNVVNNRAAAATNSNRDANPIITRRGFQQSERKITSLNGSKNSKFPCRCPDDNDNDDDELLQDDDSRREAMFAMIGSLWAATTTISTTISTSPKPAYATYGIDAKMTFPNPIESMSDRANKQCLVESLGNRECLVYQEDEEKLLYKGADVTILLERIAKAATSLENDIPPLVAAKKWTQLTGILTGPMGQLSSTMALLEKLSDNPNLAKSNSQKVKQDVFAIGSAVTNKQGDVVLKYQQLAIQDLAVFLKSL